VLAQSLLFVYHMLIWCLTYGAFALYLGMLFFVDLWIFFVFVAILARCAGFIRYCSTLFANVKGER